MKRFLLVKLGGSEMMAQLIGQALSPYLAVEGEDPRSTNTGTTLMFHFQSYHPIDELMAQMKSLAIANFVLTEVNEDTFRANLSDRIDLGPDGKSGLRLNRFKHVSEKSIEEMSEEELQEELNVAIEHQLFERAGEIRDRLNDLQQ